MARRERVGGTDTVRRSDAILTNFISQILEIILHSGFPLELSTTISAMHTTLRLTLLCIPTEVPSPPQLLWAMYSPYWKIKGRKAIYPASPTDHELAGIKGKAKATCRDYENPTPGPSSFSGRQPRSPEDESSQILPQS